jgi:hypothetical protein
MSGEYHLGQYARPVRDDYKYEGHDSDITEISYCQLRRGKENNYSCAQHNDRQVFLAER